MKGKILLISGAVIILLAVIIVSAVNMINGNSANAALGDNANTIGNTDSGSGTGFQDVTLTAKGLDYTLTPSAFKRGVPVRITVDLNTVTGCGRDIVISAFNVRKYVKPGDNVITFTPDKDGTFGIACSMNMYRGQFTVSDDGKALLAANTPNVPVQAAQRTSLSGGSGGCSMSGGGSGSSGGCGCMG